MNIQDFIANFAEQFDETDANLIVASTNFRELEEWSSIIALSVIAMADESYNVKLKGDDIRSANTVEEIYQIIKSRI